MKNLLSILLIFTLFCGMNKAYSMTFGQAISQNKPLAVLIYADWADDMQKVSSAYDSMEQKYAGAYNFIKINVCKEEAKEFNQTYSIYSNLPYVLLFKDRGRISRYLKKDCILDNSCFKEKLDFFNN